MHSEDMKNDAAPKTTDKSSTSATTASRSARSVWFITGASKGLGLVVARKLLAAGYRVAATSRSLADLTSKLGPASESFLPLELDLGSEASARRAAAATRAHFGRLDVIVNNAGYGQLGTVEEVSDEEARRNFDVNVFGVLNVLRAALPTLREQRAGHIFNISSIGGFVGGFSGFGVYCATKFALAGLSESLHADLAPFGVHVTLVYPGYFRTEFLASGSINRPAHPIAAYEFARGSEEKHLQEINGNQPGDPEKLADALIRAHQLDAPPLHLFLGSDAFAMAEAKQDQVRKELTEHRALSVSTDF
jgi:NAD(P)-dependent dehydrogenase (short-subunit alcohol dehydrogenase family)